MKRPGLAFLLHAAVLAAACASQGDPYANEGPREVELILTNEYRSAMTAYVQWLQGSPTPLGEVRAGSSITVRTRVRGQEMRVFFVVPGRSAGNPRLPEYAIARAGDRFEWLLRSDRTTFYLRRS